MPLQLLKYNPGIVKDITQYSAGKNGPYWVDGDLVRFRNGYPTKIGGWQNEQMSGLNPAGDVTTNTVTLQGIGRRMIYWRAIADGEDRIAVGTHNHLYIVENGYLYDITPLRSQTGTVTTTAEELDISETDIDLTSVDGFPASGAVKIESEIITYAGISGLTLTGCTRGTNGTSAATHADGSTATQTLIDPIATVDGSTTVTITDIGHGAETGDWVIMSGSADI